MFERYLKIEKTDTRTDILTYRENWLVNIYTFSIPNIQLDALQTC